MFQTGSSKNTLTSFLMPPFDDYKIGGILPAYQRSIRQTQLTTWHHTMAGWTCRMKVTHFRDRFLAVIIPARRTICIRRYSYDSKSLLEDCKNNILYYNITYLFISNSPSIAMLCFPVQLRCHVCTIYLC